ncbi:MAG: glycosyl hydrolase [Thermoguttaceae bacterium]
MIIYETGMDMMLKKNLAAGLLLGLMACNVVTIAQDAKAATAAAGSEGERFEQNAFRTPANTYRSVPFYSLYDDLDAAELDRQLHRFKEGGFGGTFLHSRMGLLTEYLSKTWFDVMAAGVKSSQELGIDAWFYDEDKWPSGFAGGIVPLKDPAFQARSLVRVKKDQAINPPDTVLFEDASFKYVCHVNPLGDAWFNGTSWVDLMNPAMVKAFIDCSYVPYVEKFGGQPRVLGIFTDEPQISPRAKIANQGAISYSPVIPAAFKARSGYELAPHLPSLFAEVGPWRKVRLDYYRTVAACFEQAFSKQIGDYCAAHQFIWTGHYNSEDAPTGNMLNEGNLMQQLRHMQMPGIDALGLHYNTLHCGKVMTSVANQYGRTRRLSELFGISGHNMTFEDRMWITAWHTLMGVNFMCPHLSLYSMKGERKRDYPPTISYQQPYWRYNRLFEDFSARLCYFATVGQTTPEVCVLSPIESDYIEHAQKLSGKRDAAFAGLLNALVRTHRNFDLGDEQIISEIGRAASGRFEIGKMAYRVVVVPSMLTIRASTLALLKAFAAQGGTVLVAEAYPSLVDGEEDAAAMEELKSYAPLVKGDGWLDALNQKVPPVFTLSGAKNEEVWTHLRTVANGFSLQLSNSSRLENRTLSLRFSDRDAAVALWNPVNGQCLRLKPEADGSYALDFSPAETWIVTVGPVSANAQFDGDYSLPGERQEVVKLAGPWQGKRVDPNALTLDYARYSKDGGATWSEPEPVLAIYDRFAQSTPYKGELKLKFEPEITDVPSACKLVVEQPEMYTSITVNGKQVVFDANDSYTCFTFRAKTVDGLLKQGHNEIVLTLNYVSAIPTSLNARARYGTEIESIYLIGDFAVKSVVADKPLKTTYRNQEGALVPKPIHSFKSFAITREQHAFSGDLAPQGYPFYAGEFQLDSTFELGAVEAGKKYLLAFPSFEAVVINVTVNGQPCPPLMASPWETDVTAALKPGKNTVRVSLTNSLRNLMGPHHHKGGEHTAVGPATFRANHYWPNREPGEVNWYDARLGGKAKVWRDDYYLIPFGLLQPPVLIQRPAANR